MAECIFEKTRLLFVNQTCHIDGCVYIGKSIMGMCMTYIVSHGELFKFEGGQSVVFCYPVNSIRPQVMRCSDKVDDIPSGIPVGPFSLIGIKEVAVKKVSYKLIIKVQIVVACYTCSGN